MEEIVLELNLFKNIKKEMENNGGIQNLLDELGDFLNNIQTSAKQNNNVEHNTNVQTNKELEEQRKEGHLYLVTEDRNNEIYLWDFTEKAKTEFKETITSEELLKVAKEGAMLQYKNGKYELYSPNGFDIVSEAKN